MDLLRYYLEERFKDIDFNTFTNSREGLVYLSAKNSNREICQILIQKEKEQNINSFSGPVPPIVTAIKNDNYDACSILIESKSDINEIYEFDSPICHAMKKLNYDIFSLLIEKGADPNVCGNPDHPPLFFTFKIPGVDKWDYFKKLIDKVDVRQCNLSFEGKTPLIHSIFEDSVSMCSSILKRGVDPNQPDENNVRPLYYAAKFGNFDICKLLIDHGADCNLPSEVHGEFVFPLTIPLQKSDEKLCELLVSSGHNLNYTFRHSESFTDTVSRATPLAFALSSKISYNLIKLFIEHGANPNNGTCYMAGKEVKELSTPLLIACLREEKDNVIALLIENGADIYHKLADLPMPLYISQYYRGRITEDMRLHALSVLLNEWKKGKEEMCTEILRVEIIHTSQTPPNLDIIKLLVNHGAILDCNYSFTNNPLIFAICEQSTKENILDYLIKNASNINSVISRSDYLPLTLFSHAARNGNLKACQILLKYGASLDGENGIIPLIHAAVFGHISVMKFLIDNHVNPNAYFRDSPILVHVITIVGRTVCSQKNTSGIETLINYRVNVNEVPPCGHTPLTAAVVYSDIDTVKLLIKNGADVNLCINGHKLSFLDLSELSTVPPECYCKDLCKIPPIMLAVRYAVNEIFDLLKENNAKITPDLRAGDTTLIGLGISTDLYLSKKIWSCMDLGKSKSLDFSTCAGLKNIDGFSFQAMTQDFSCKDNLVELKFSKISTYQMNFVLFSEFIKGFKNLRKLTISKSSIDCSNEHILSFLDHNHLVYLDLSGINLCYPHMLELYEKLSDSLSIRNLVLGYDMRHTRYTDIMIFKDYNDLLIRNNSFSQSLQLILCERHLNENSVWYVDFLPLDVFKIIVKLSELFLYTSQDDVFKLINDTGEIQHGWNIDDETLRELQKAREEQDLFTKKRKTEDH